jgi:spore cortex formation protein SpoVR/YcgB (stage V sporulation)
MKKPFFTSADWTFELIAEAYDHIEKIGVGEMGLDIYKNQIEVITAEQMLDAYSSIGLPLMYKHWSFGKHFSQDADDYKRGKKGLAFEIVINSNPCINYIMEENTMTMQCLVIAHAAMGHNHFFKNNYLFREWTNADLILDYLAFAKKFIAECEEKYGMEIVEETLNAAHSIMNQSVDKSKRRRTDITGKKEKEKNKARIKYELDNFNELWTTIPKSPSSPVDLDGIREAKELNLPEENIAYFLQKYSPKLKDWQREILRIVRVLAQYFYPQRQTKVMNEGCATFVHYEIFNRMYDKGLLTPGSMLEFAHMHSAVIAQQSYKSPYYSGFNPYALGFAIMQDIKRMCLSPTTEDKEWFPDIAGNPDYLSVLKYCWKNYRDESFLLQFLSPKVIRDFRMFNLRTEQHDDHYDVKNIHSEEGYKNIRMALASSYDISNYDPNIQVTSADLDGSRRLELTHYVHNGTLLKEADRDLVIKNVANLWGYRARIKEVFPNGITGKDVEALPTIGIFD